MTTEPLTLQRVEPRRPKPRRRRPKVVLVILTIAYLGVIAYITLSPNTDDGSIRGLYHFVMDHLGRLPIVGRLTEDQLEFTLNIGMFVPLGFLFALLFGKHWFWLGALAGLGVSLGIEAAQHYIAFRVPDTRDLIANGLGGVIGSLLGFLVLGVRQAVRRH